MQRDFESWVEFVKNQISTKKVKYKIREEDIYGAATALERMGNLLPEMEDPAIHNIGTALHVKFYDKKFNLSKKGVKQFILVGMHVYGNSIILTRSEKSEAIMEGTFDGSKGWNKPKESVPNVKNWDLYKSPSFKLLYLYTKGKPLPEITNFEYEHLNIKNAEESYVNIKDFELPTKGLLKKLNEQFEGEIPEPEILDSYTRRILKWKLNNQVEIKAIIRNGGLKIRVKYAGKVKKGSAASIISLLNTNIWTEMLNAFEESFVDYSRRQILEKEKEFLKTSPFTEEAIKELKKWGVPEPNNIQTRGSSTKYLVWKYGESFYILGCAVDGTFNWYGKANSCVRFKHPKPFYNLQEFLNSEDFILWVENVVEKETLDTSWPRKKKPSKRKEISPKISAYKEVEEVQDNSIPTMKDMAISVLKTLYKENSTNVQTFVKVIMEMQEILQKNDIETNLIAEAFKGEK